VIVWKIYLGSHIFILVRHTFSTRANKYGVGAFDQKELFGHSKLTMTDRYTHISKETLKHSLRNIEPFIVNKK
jgi:site-specific recombinase XerD